MNSLPETQSTQSQKMGNVETVVLEILHHTGSNKGVVELPKLLGLQGLKNPDVVATAAEAFGRLSGRLETEVEDLRTVYAHLKKLRELATQKGYADVLELLDQNLHYDRGY
ncbi:MAG: hypothetical protein AABX33_00975 [Nanoarchaeota archaeon]